MENLRKEIIETLAQLHEHEKRLLLLFSCALVNNRDELDIFTLEEITESIELLKELEAEESNERNAFVIEWLQAIKAERENG